MQVLLAACICMMASVICAADKEPVKQPETTVKKEIAFLGVVTRSVTDELVSRQLGIAPNTGLIVERVKDGASRAIRFKLQVSEVCISGMARSQG